MIKKFFISNSIHKRIAPKLDILFVFNPIIFFIIWVLICVGIYLNTFYPSFFYREASLYLLDFNVKTFILFFSISFLLSICIIKNTNDGENVKSPETPSPELTGENYLISSHVTSIINLKNYFIFLCLLLLFFLKWELCVLGILFYGLMEHVSKNDKIKFPYKNNVCNIICCYLLIASGFIYVSDGFILEIIHYRFLILILPYILFCLSINVIMDMNSIIAYSKINKKTTAFISFFLMSSALSISLYLNDPLSSTAIAVCLPFFLYVFFRTLRKDIVRAIRYPIAILNFFTMLIFPYLFISILIVFYISKYYYWHRLDIHYPTFLVDD